MTLTNLSPSIEPEQDDGLLNAPRECSLFLDVDGTLLEMASSPEAVRVPSGLTALLQSLSDGLGGALAILTGRQLISVDRLLDPLQLAGSGVHGAQVRWTPGGHIETLSPELPAELIARLAALEAAMPGVQAEQKGPGLAMHYRMVPHVEAELDAALTQIVTDYAASVVLTRGRKIFEVLPVGTTKGTALVAFCRLPAFKGRCPVMIGDDVGDEPAFTEAIRLGGAGLRVAGEHFSGGAAQLSGPADVHALLMRVSARLSHNAAG
jgi:trehalose 6-phosphate phosphatase